VIGINTAIFSPNGGSVGIGFAIPSNLAKGVIAQLRENGTVSRGWLGVQIQQVTPEIADSLGLPQPKGALVADVTANSPAAKSKIQAGDVILSLDSRPVDTIKDLTRMVADSKTGSDVTLEVLRKGKHQNIKVTLDQMPDQPKVAAATPAPESSGSHTVMGLKLSSLDQANRRKYGLADGIEGVLVVGLDDTMSDVNLRPGDVITEVGNERVAAPDQVAAKIKEAKDAGRGAVLLRVSRQGTEQFVAVSIKKA
jgi:serine protease Do